MNKNKDNNNLKVKRFVLLYGVPSIILIIIIISIVFIIYPTYNNVNKYNSKIAYYNSRNVKLNEEITMLKSYSTKSAKAKLKSDLSTLNNIIPNQLQFVLTSAKVQSLGEKAGLLFKNLSTAQLPQSFKNPIILSGLSSNVTANNVYVSFNGNYTQLKQYISYLESNKILFVIPDVLYKGYVSGSNLPNPATMSFNITFFSAPDSSNSNYEGGLISESSLNKFLLNFK